ncbi:MAG: adenine deaminase [Bacteroidetes bacterium]|nr:adenine deaminase [Bacteroidota bacterium]
MITLFHNYVDLHQRKIYPAEIQYDKDKIISIKETKQPCNHFILPGFVDAHIHIESSMLVPSEFARLAVRHGTVATVSDPHEIANVCGIEGVNFMINNAKKVPFKFHFGAPSCVPATAFETSGAIINSDDINDLMAREDIYFLSEMMNYPGVLFQDEEVMRKIDFAKAHGKPVDGHAPGLRGEQAKKYIDAGISTDHECFTKEEALDKLKCGMKILIREGSAAKNFEALIDLLPDYENEMMFCCDDKHPDELLLHHINQHVKRAIAKGIDVFTVLQAACINPVLHYKLPVGLLQVHDAADFIVVNNLQEFEILQTVIDGITVFDNNICHIHSVHEEPINHFQCSEKSLTDFVIPAAEKSHLIRVIEALEGQLITRTQIIQAKIENQELVSDIEQDVLKLVVVNRYSDAVVAKAFIKNFGFTRGAIASTVAHDSHNIICVGVTDQDIQRAVNALVLCKGGISVIDEEAELVMPLSVAGLMSHHKAEEIAAQYAEANTKAKALGSKLAAPFMTLSFMALLVIPQLKLSDKGLFDGEKFEFIDLFCNPS